MIFKIGNDCPPPLLFFYLCFICYITGFSHYYYYGYFVIMHVCGGLLGFSSSPQKMSENEQIKIALERFREAEAEDAIVCRFGPDYFRGARTGAFTGAWCAAFCSFFVHRHMKKDQLQADYEAGFAKGVRNPDFPRGVVRRGLRTQPMLALGCICLRITCVLKLCKTFLAHRRCREFDVDDLGFELLRDMAHENSEIPELLSRMQQELTRSEETKKRGDILEDLRHSQQSGERWGIERVIQKQTSGPLGGQRPPSYMDGVAVGLAGSIFDCFLPQKPPSAYYNMTFGYGR